MISNEQFNLLGVVFPAGELSKAKAVARPAYRLSWITPKPNCVEPKERFCSSRFPTLMTDLEVLKCLLSSFLGIRDTGI